MKNILIIGGGSGVGCVIVWLFLECGWKVGLIGWCVEVLFEIVQGYSDVLVLFCDVMDFVVVDVVFVKVVVEWGWLDVLFNNVGVVLILILIDEISIEQWQYVVWVNIDGMFYCVCVVFGQMCRQDLMGGCIINNGLVLVDVLCLGSVFYIMFKYVVIGLICMILLDGWFFNIVCGQIDIGNVLINMVEVMIKGVLQVDGLIKVELVIDVRMVVELVLYMVNLFKGVNIQWLIVMVMNMFYIGWGQDMVKVFVIGFYVDIDV